MKLWTCSCIGFRMPAWQNCKIVENSSPKVTNINTMMFKGLNLSIAWIRKTHTIQSFWAQSNLICFPILASTCRIQSRLSGLYTLSVAHRTWVRTRSADSHSFCFQQILTIGQTIREMSTMSSNIKDTQHGTLGLRYKNHLSQTRYPCFNLHINRSPTTLTVEGFPMPASWLRLTVQHNCPPIHTSSSIVPRHLREWRGWFRMLQCR